MALATGRVVGQFVLGVVDGADVDQEPDIVPAQGTVTFSGAAPYIPLVDAVPNPVTLMTTSIVAVLDSEGYLCTPDPFDPTKPGTRGIRLFANDDPSSPVQGWTWTVTYRFAVSNGATPTIPAHSIAVLSGAELDLTTVVKVPASPGVGEAQAFALVGRAEAAATQAALDAAVALEVKARADAGEFKGETGPAGPNTVPTDTAIATNIQTPGTETEAALNAAIGSAVIPAGSFVLLGDSITEQNGGVGQAIPYPRSRGWWTWAACFLDQRVSIARNAGIGGNTTTQMLARFDTDVAAYSSDWVFVLAGVNDIMQDVATATVIQNLASIYDKITALGRKIAVGTMIPTTSANTNSRRQGLADVNAWIVQNAREKGYPCADFYGVTVDNITGLNRAGYTIDGIHPAMEGAIRMGKALAEVLYPHFSPIPITATAPTDQSNLLQYGSLTGSSAGLIATGWTVGSADGSPAYVASREARRDLPGYEWQVFEFLAGSTGTLTFYTTSLATLATTDKVYAAVEFETVGLTGSGYIDVRVQTRDNPSTVAVGFNHAAESTADLPSTTFPGKGILRTGLATAGVSDEVLAQVRITGMTGGKIKIGRTVVKKGL